MMAWLRYQVARTLANYDRFGPRGGFYSQAENRYPRTLRGGWRWFREQTCPAEVDWYERRRDGAL